MLFQFFAGARRVIALAGQFRKVLCILASRTAVRFSVGYLTATCRVLAFLAGSHGKNPPCFTSNIQIAAALYGKLPREAARGCSGPLPHFLAALPSLFLREGCLVAAIQFFG